MGSDHMLLISRMVLPMYYIKRDNLKRNYTVLLKTYLLEEESIRHRVTERYH